MYIPEMVKVKQLFDTEPPTDIPAVVAAEFDRASVKNSIKPGQSVAVTAGSRGIKNINQITKSIIIELLELKAKPFIVPAMGSHGGATANGQAQLLEHFGISQPTMGVEIKSSMDVIFLGNTKDNIPVYIDRYASEADHIIVVNRVKPHTDFQGDIESGLLKMMAIGLGKQKSADTYHNHFMNLGHVRVITDAARVMMENCRISFGIAIVEDQRDDTSIIRMIPKHAIEQEERNLQTKAKALLPRIPFQQFDLLIVDEIGKTFSGTGMDQNVIARSVIPYHVVPSSPVITRIFVRDLSSYSGGNALGIGNADFTTSRLVDKIDRDVTYMNAITSSCPEVMRIPPSYDQDKDAIATCFMTIPLSSESDARIVHIQNTLQLETFYISKSMLSDARKNETLQIESAPVPMDFDEAGNISDMFLYFPI